MREGINLMTITGIRVQEKQRHVKDGQSFLQDP